MVLYNDLCVYNTTKYDGKPGVPLSNYHDRTESDIMAVEPRLAATVMLLRDVDAQGRRGIEVFMVRRVVQSEFLPDLYVLPGGSTAADDSSVPLFVNYLKKPMCCSRTAMMRFWRYARIK